MQCMECAKTKDVDMLMEGKCEGMVTQDGKVVDIDKRAKSRKNDRCLLIHVLEI